MGYGELAYRLTHMTGVRNLVPKRVRNRAYMMYVEELIYRRVREQRATEIFDTPPTVCDPDSPLKVWMLMRDSDLLMATWAIKSLVYQTGRAWDVWLADGGGLAGAAGALRSHFPNARVMLEPELDAAVRDTLAPYPLCHWLRFDRDYACARKLFDLAVHLPNSKCLLLDTDVLFFRRPTAIVDALVDPDPTAPNRFSLDSGLGIICSGVGVANTGRIHLPEIESILAAMSPAQRAAWWVEQDVYAQLSSTVDGLSSEYALGPASDEEHERLVTCHYIHTCRHRFYGQGVRRLRAAGMLDR